MSDKTEEPTPRRKQRALEEGDSGASSVFGQALGFTVAVTLAPVAFTQLGDWAATSLRAILSKPHGSALDNDTIVSLTIVPVLQFAVPLLLAVGVVGGTAVALQAGGVVTFGKLAPRLERLDPIKGARNLLSPVRALSVLRAFLAATAVAWFAVRELRAHAGDVVLLAGRTNEVISVARTLVLGVAKGAIAVALVLGGLDLLVTRRAWLKRLRMSKDEVKREHKESEGDPEIRHARQRSHQELLAAASARAVKGATVVVVNPTHLACALRYDEDESDAPVVLANGEGLIAQEIVRAARDYGVPIVQNVPLARALLEIEVGSAIPESLYETVAEVLRELLDQAEG